MPLIFNISAALSEGFIYLYCGTALKCMNETYILIGVGTLSDIRIPGKRSQKINSGATEAAAESNSKADEEKLFTVTVKQNHSPKSFESLKKKQSKQRLGQVQWIPFYLQLRNKLRLLRVQKKNRRVKGEKLSLGSRN
ncbi:hypothetical protein YC2023_005120 [Brassica napus]